MMLIFAIIIKPKYQKNHTLLVDDLLYNKIGAKFVTLVCINNISHNG